MRRFDRAMYALFLLALLADVARAHASVTIGADGASGLILSAASQLQVGPAGKAILVLKRSGSSPEMARVERFRLRISGWSKNFSDLSSPALQPGSVSASGDGSPLVPPGSPALAIFEHAGSPAP